MKALLLESLCVLIVAAALAVGALAGALVGIQTGVPFLWAVGAVVLGGLAYNFARTRI